MKATRTRSLASLGALLGATALLAACGGGGSDDLDVGLTAQNKPSSSAKSALLPNGSTLVLDDLPSNPTASTRAAITHSLTGAGKVYCRRDGYAPIACPNPLKLGDSVPLAAGSHTVDYYVDTGKGIDSGAPAASYTWKVSATSTTTASSSAAPLSNLSYPSSLIASGVSSNSWNGSSAVRDLSSNVALSRQADPKGSGKMVNLHRITKGSSKIWGGVRAENAWQNKSLVPGHDYWMSFAVMMKPDEAIVPNKADDTMLVFQTHTPAAGATQPDIALFWRGQDKTIYWQVAHNSRPSNTWKYVGGSNPDVQGTWRSSPEAMPAAGVWTRFIVHYRPGYASSHKPIVEIWRAAAGSDYTKVVNHTGLNTYNSLAGPSYPRIGLYKWSSSAWNTKSLGFYMTPLSFGEGANLFDSAKSALAGL